ncbi:pheromone A receptor-domain-containing protein [Mycena rebaudengoi]|nr:pheromone A receptor-domain-containing protein [Mycena rebaudengoi]
MSQAWAAWRKNGAIGNRFNSGSDLPCLPLLSFVLALIPLPWHLQAWNSGTCLFIIWVALSCLSGFINSLVWRDTVRDLAPAWRDFSMHLTVVIAVAIPAASLCINHRLYHVASCKTVSISKAEKRRAVLVDLAIGLGIPFSQGPLQFIVQGHQYDIIENVGCYPTTYNVVPTYPLSYLWPNIIDLVSATYALVTLRAFLHRRAQFATLLTNNSALTPNRYFRLMALAALELLFNLPLSSYGLYLSASREPINPWVSWANTHADFSFVGQVFAILWRSEPHTRATVELSRWAGVICALVFFAFFGFAAEARKHYALAFWAVAKRLGFTPPADGALPFPWRKARLSASAAAAQSGTTAVSFPLTPQKQRHDSLSASLADTSTDFDDVDIKGDFAPPSPASDGPPRDRARRVCPPRLPDAGAHRARRIHRLPRVHQLALPPHARQCPPAATRPRRVLPVRVLVVFTLLPCLFLFLIVFLVYTFLARLSTHLPPPHCQCVLTAPLPPILFSSNSFSLVVSPTHPIIACILAQSTVFLASRTPNAPSFAPLQYNSTNTYLL